MRRPAGGEDLMTVVQGLISETAGGSRHLSSPSSSPHFHKHCKAEAVELKQNN
ncbi:hypothetical protein SNOG_04707 [Parastagonospora nodorum SN15]|uniref:Uncharacterized protein n=1 Tax=Phaeosphaeria nodorum (strain SN15 / ATCC MYA-4574 / FGSC 10173) TaxID=321614 RepID=Q0UU57_PHANO|nr:hypothetical protein SNOG_04707 [Parastagonospora nodorum SN15]EAT88467.1 hypothetical protein SNOG_04707 [Parastagonospora nodorum SN15]